MEPHILKKLYLLPLVMGVWISCGMIICFIMALSEGHVSAYVPFISETGGKLPESGIFGIFLVFTAYMGMAVMTIRYLLVSELNEGSIRKIDILNKISLFVGYLSLCGMIIVGCYPMYGIISAHVTGAVLLFFGCLFYGILQTILTFWMYPTYNGILIFRIRLAICTFCILFLITLTIIFPLGRRLWNQMKPKADKVPSDRGFTEILTSAICEWFLAISFIFFFFTFVREFRKVTLHLSLVPLVRHFDDVVS
ncbi:DNA damage-regulated autophagy modulator protein 1-like isoform X1 [Centruroides sculpturatus]|uniref:DNA damage-regulated autophagy modulator protein 1-like isoform X1 n=1 Tax=Centruroides sculpturatus TaxID=218467 RepID=UPI000C6D2830|nr:DNA damage-regulated autophagy modulator protein 1-like isoform X1 [Centruroides sculpturatus]XP_023221526.1 DNA damage-regulated autophagy modulator protein 1-like isoform X1 [Centruroides sculpturatus]XP_023221527.1 DNA damage-regulated autophagy modulator protein 1-like isoform X1 [Centruroides sculpturatus]XP_023221528.1 DNA damage-regulated autophagy modulator protein 1-like isoform X1 [Centruroides sculpturatus]XP_023221529.1 DNA damage-regulated autophagy modulator protein 1-like isof